MGVQVSRPFAAVVCFDRARSSQSLHLQHAVIEAAVLQWRFIDIAEFIKLVGFVIEVIGRFVKSFSVKARPDWRSKAVVNECFSEGDGGVRSVMRVDCSSATGNALRRSAIEFPTLSFRRSQKLVMARTEPRL